MAGRLLNRRDLREQAEHAERQDKEAGAEVTSDTKPAKVGKTKKAAAPRVRKPRAKKAPPRMCARWGVFDAGMKQVAVYDYNQRASADEKLATLQGKAKGAYFIQLVKEPMAEPETVGVV